jgi:hypothetical protein
MLVVKRRQILQRRVPRLRLVTRKKRRRTGVSPVLLFVPDREYCYNIIFGHLWSAASFLS